MQTELRLFDYLDQQVRQFPQERAFGEKSGAGWQFTSSADMARRVRRISLGLLGLGLRPGDKVATVVSRTTPDWVALDYAMLQVGVLNVPLYPTISAREYAYILQESGALYAVAGDADLYEKVRQARATCPALREIFTFTDHPEARRWDSALLGPDDGDFSEVDRIKDSIRPDDVATLIYTSGTTGFPKGVTLSHRNLVFNVETMRPHVPLRPGHRTLSFLPVSHVFERAVVYAYTAYGASVYFTGTEQLGGEDGDLRSVRPHFFTAVPRLLEKVYERIMARGQALRGLKRAIFFWAIDMIDRWDFDRRPGGWEGFKWRLADRLVFSKWREALGGEIQGIITGASACPVRILRAFNAAGIPLREAYGLSEAAPALTFNRLTPGGAMFGTVGSPLEGVIIRIEKPEEGAGSDGPPGEGEILANSPGIMLGYYRQPEKTAEVIREIDGKRWLITGDIGRMVDGPGGRKFLQITDRKKELLKTSNGKYVAPSPIESRLKEHPLVEQAMVVGDNRKYVSALIVPHAEGLQAWCDRHHLPWTSLADAIRRPEVLKRYDMVLERVNPDFSPHEQVKKFTLLPQTWEPIKTDGTEAELAPTLKLKRRVILEKFREEIERMYG
jgi:long-chain acyl-CoA synthetase